MLNPKLSPLEDFPFGKLNDTLAAITPPSGRDPIALTVGEPQNQPPAFLSETVAKYGHLWNKYPSPNGDEEFRETIAGWLTRRFNLNDGMIHPEKHVIPVAGTREPLFHIGFIVTPRQKAGKRPVMLLPNPFYHVYRSGTLISDAEIVFMPALAENNFLPDLDALDPDVLDRTTVFFLCSPANPQGTVADLDYWKRAVELARRHDFVLVGDECYSEIYRDAPPTGVLEACKDLGGSLENVIAFHSLSKRSSAAGLRSGFIAGDERIIQKYKVLVSGGLAPLPTPLLKASTALWQDEVHVEANRAYYRENFEIADQILGNRITEPRPAAGFFLWLDVGNGMETAKKLWAHAGVKALPGELIAKPDANGVNPGDKYLRVALVYDAETTRAGLNALAEVL